MAEIVASLRKQEFPVCIKKALEQLEAYCPDEGTSIPGLGDDITEQIVEHFVFCQVPIGRSRHAKQKLSAVQELQMLEVLISHFEKQPEELLCRGVFRILFHNNLTASRRDLLCRLVSMAVSVKCSKILDSAAAWMQAHGCNTDPVIQVAQGLVKDYCQLVPGPVEALHCLPQLSAHFTCNFITALTNCYGPPGSKGGRPVIPTPVLQMITDWILQDPRLCLVSLCESTGASFSRSNLWTSPTKPNTQTPIPGLLRWCTKAPVLASSASNSKELHRTNLEQDKLWETWSKLHLGILQSTLAFPTLPGSAQLEVITLADMRRIVSDVTVLVKKTCPGSEQGQVAIDRVLQVLQVSLATGGFRCSLGDLRAIFQEIPSNRLLAILQKQHLSTAPPQMHNVP